MNKEAIEKRFDALIIKNNGIFPENGEYDVHLTDIGAHLPVSVLRQRARELGYINGYRWGVEYPTNGKKPDLTDDVVVYARTNGDECGKGAFVKEFYWPDYRNLKIVDDRYKPADTSYLGTPALEPVPQELSWYDYDNQKAIALPPVGEKVALWHKNSEQGVAELVSQKGNEAVWWNHDNPRFQSGYLKDYDFKPLDHNRKAEAEKKRVVDAAMAIAVDAHMTEDILGSLYDAGYLKLPE